MNVIARLEFEPAYYDSALHRFNHSTTRTPLFIREFFTSVLADGFPLEFEWQQVSSNLQDSSQYSVQSQHCCSLNSLHLSSYFSCPQVPLLIHWWLYRMYQLQLVSLSSSCSIVCFFQFSTKVFLFSPCLSFTLWSTGFFFIYVDTHIHKHTRAYTRTHTHAYTHIYQHLWIYFLVHTHTHTHALTHAYTQAHTHTHTHTHILSTFMCLFFRSHTSPHTLIDR